MDLWCEHCRDHFPIDHYSEEGSHLIGPEYGPTGSDMMEMEMRDDGFQKAIMAEREACAKLAESLGSKRIANTIRNRK